MSPKNKKRKTVRPKGKTSEFSPPITMATQHPDNACEAYWCGKKFINTADEIEECYRVFQELGIQEYMWDWEGKFVDEAVIDRLFQKYQSFFAKHPLGKEIFLTFRIPNVWQERGYRLARAFMSILTAADLARQMGFHHPPIFEVILPMTKSAEQLMFVNKTFWGTHKIKKEVFGGEKRADFDNFNVIPLFEEIGDLTNVDKVLREYLKMYQKEYKRKPAYLRPFVARSDPALNAGLVPAVISVKAALSHFYRLSEEFKIPFYPIIGTGSLPFRGGVNPDNIKETIQEFAGIRTITLQSAFRYDYELPKVKKAIKLIHEKLPTLSPKILSHGDLQKIDKLNRIFAGFYRPTVEAIAPIINNISSQIPSRRERLLHIGLFGYSRGIGKVKLPRAINFTAALYSLGIPPEFIGTGRGLQKADQLGLSKFLRDIYINLEADLLHAGKYLNKENLNFLADQNPAFKDIQKDVELIEAFLGRKLGPQKTHHFIHRNLVSSIYLHLREGEDFTDELEKAAKIRKSLG
jgi:phosphoenolpyruvate carboxylase